MATHDRLIDRARARARRLRTGIGNDLKEARVEHNLSQTAISAATGIPQSWYSLIERGLADRVTLEDLALASQAVGRDLVLKTYPSGPPVRDAAHTALLTDLRRELPRGAGWQTEVTIGIPGDQRAWDAVIRFGDLAIGVEAETKLRDVQAIARRIALKKRDSEIERVALVVRAWRSNRDLVRALLPDLRAAFPVPSTDALDALRAGRDPGGAAIILI